jgi:hypothetical protein
VRLGQGETETNGRTGRIDVPPRQPLALTGIFNADRRASRSGLSRGVTADLRLESFNLTNTLPFGNPNTQVGNPSFGRISSAGAARSSQIALKLLF